MTIQGAPVLTGGQNTLDIEGAQLILDAGAAPVCTGGKSYGAYLDVSQEGLVISGGKFSGAEYGLQVGEGITGLTITGGTFTGTEYSGVELLSAATITGGTFTGGLAGAYLVEPKSDEV